MGRLQPGKLHVRLGAGLIAGEPVMPRRYTLTHSDASGDLFLTIGQEYDRNQVAGWYTRLMRDEVLAEWRDEGDGAVRGLVLWAASPAASDGLSSCQLAASSIHSARDGLATPEKIDASRPLLPPDTQWTAIKSGNRAQFSWYRPQAGDNEAIISRKEQQAQIVAATLQSLLRLDE